MTVDIGVETFVTEESVCGILNKYGKVFTTQNCATPKQNGNVLCMTTFTVSC